MRAHCEAQQSQITHLSQQVGLSRTREATLQDQKKGLEVSKGQCSTWWEEGGRVLIWKTDCVV